MPRLWNDTVQEHRSSVREAVLDAVARIVADGGVPAVSMTKVAERAGISRATLYKYFPEVESLLTGWQERQVGQHLAHLVQVRAHAGRSGGGPLQVLRSVLEADASMVQESRDARCVGVPAVWCARLLSAGAPARGFLRT